MITCEPNHSPTRSASCEMQNEFSNILSFKSPAWQHFDFHGDDCDDHQTNELFYCWGKSGLVPHWIIIDLLGQLSINHLTWDYALFELWTKRSQYVSSELRRTPYEHGNLTVTHMKHHHLIGSLTGERPKKPSYIFEDGSFF